MAKAVKKKYAEFESEFLERKLEELKEYMENRPLDLLKDRVEWKQTRNGGMMPMVIATIEAQRKDLAAAMKDYAEISLLVKELRRDADQIQQAEARGSSNIPYVMRKRD